jgi:hypothetical protein
MKKETLSSPAGRHKKLAKLSCKEIAKHICGELDEHLDSPQCRAIKKHMETCPNCTAYLDSLKKTVRFYKYYSGPKLSAKCREELFTRIQLKKKRSSSQKHG